MNLTKLRMINKVRIDASINNSIKDSLRNKYEWHYPANRSYILEEDPPGMREKELILSDLIAYSYLPSINSEEKLLLLKKIYGFNANIDAANEDEMLELAAKFSKKAETASYPKKITEFILNVPIGVCRRDGKFDVNLDYITSLLGPSPVFVHLLKRHEKNVGYLYELRALLESDINSILKCYAEQEESIKGVLGAEYFSMLFPFLLLLNRQGKYIFPNSAGLQSCNFTLPPSYVVENLGARSIILSLGDIFTSDGHSMWFVNEFVENNSLWEVFLTLKDIVGTIEYKRFFIVVSTELNLIYKNYVEYYKLTNYGLEKYR